MGLKDVDNHFSSFLAMKIVVMLFSTALLCRIKTVLKFSNSSDSVLTMQK